MFGNAQDVIDRIKKRTTATIPTVAAQNILDRIKERRDSRSGEPVNPICNVGDYVMYFPRARSKDDDDPFVQYCQWGIVRIDNIVRRYMHPGETSSGQNCYDSDMGCGITISKTDYGWERFTTTLREDQIVCVFRDEAEADRASEALLRATKLIDATRFLPFIPIINECVSLVESHEEIEHLVIEMEKLWATIEEPIKLFNTKMSLFVNQREHKDDD